MEVVLKKKNIHSYWEESENHTGKSIIFLDLQMAFDNAPYTLMQVYEETKLTWDEGKDISYR